jgi:hypothetical protein
LVYLVEKHAGLLKPSQVGLDGVAGNSRQFTELFAAMAFKMAS